MIKAYSNNLYRQGHHRVCSGVRCHIRSHIKWDSDPVHGNYLLHRVDKLTDLVSERLLTRPGYDITGAGLQESEYSTRHLQL